ncbi:putative acetyltransferase [Indibacter alkaliphilus LW1]|jgi:putative acetyltransferase|uniref:Acetyltransferase n=1 Tax=Indibacter alkaliphilus (strain CCUG 57479 / KCTC 22604 / LW1) TaxID=1189612 RepID=S2DIJ7_INDAL|nr:GNAT family N-acetyltransferase [Indibacter alkaliphilus]EOZ97020.1 putative acetyltransferase [Indibacter alkaliphilus LW1]
MLEISRTQTIDPDFIELVIELDKELAIRDGEDHDFYDQFNKLDMIRHVVVAYLFGTPVGCGAIKSFDEHRMEIKRMFVRPDRRGIGIASDLLMELEIWAEELGYDYCILETGVNQPEAIALYQKNGYLQIPNYGQYQGVESSLCFEKFIKT